METSIDFLAPRFEGERFKDHKLPLDVLKDLVALQEMIGAAAKWKYLHDHPGRVRLPRGFSESVSLDLVQVQEGSAIPVIKLTLLSLALLFPELDEQNRCYTWARDALIETIATAEAGNYQAYPLPDELLVHFQHVGQSLRDGESISFDPGNHYRPARLTKETRSAILSRSSRTNEQTTQVTVRGMVPEMDQEKATFEFQIAPEQRVKVTFSPEHRECVMQAFNGYRDGKKIMIRGLARYNRNEKLLGFAAVDAMVLLMKLDPGARLQEFKQLDNGWLDGKGLAPDPVQLDWLDSALQKFYPDGPLPYLYPTAEGGVQAEWTLGSWDISLNIDLPQHHGEWHALHLVTDEEDSRVLNLDNPSDWHWLQNKVKALETTAA